MNYDFILESYLEENEITIEDASKIETEDILGSIKNITLAYFDPCFKDISEELIAVWIIEMEKSIYAFDVYDGLLIYRKIK